MSKTSRGKYPRPRAMSALEERDRLEWQKHLCAMCFCPLKSLPYPDGSKYCKDHDHDTDKIRGLICVKCNTKLGALGDSLKTIKESVDQATIYLKKTEGPWEYKGREYVTKSALIFAYLDGNQVFLGNEMPPNLKQAMIDLDLYLVHGEFGARLADYCDMVRKDEHGRYKVSRVQLKKGKSGRKYILNSSNTQAEVING